MLLRCHLGRGLCWDNKLNNGQGGVAWCFQPFLFLVAEVDVYAWSIHLIIHSYFQNVHIKTWTLHSFCNVKLAFWPQPSKSYSFSSKQWLVMTVPQTNHQVWLKSSLKLAQSHSWEHALGEESPCLLLTISRRMLEFTSALKVAYVVWKLHTVPAILERRLYGFFGVLQ